MERVLDRSASWFLAFIALHAALLVLAPASALDPASDVSQYGHQGWKVRDGFVNSRVAAITQTGDGYLWFGTLTGLVRFDGVRTVPFKPSGKVQLPSQDIRALLPARDGTLWIGTFDGLASWKDGKLSRHPELNQLTVTELVEDRDGTIWAAGATDARGPGRLCGFSPNGRGGRCFGGDLRFEPGSFRLRLLVDSRGFLWAAHDDRLWRVRPGPVRAYSLPADRLGGLAEDPNHPGAILVSAANGISRFVNDKFEPFELPGSLRVATGRLLRDRDGNLWIGTDHQGLLHLHRGTLDAFDDSDGLSAGNFVRPIYQDREGNIWVGGDDGVDRFHDISVATIAARQGLLNSSAVSVLAASDGTIWFGSEAAGLGRLKGNDLIYYKPAVDSSDSIGKETQTPSVSHLPRVIADPGLPSSDILSLLEDSRGRIWASSTSGLAYFENGHFTRVPAPNFYVSAMAEDRSGLWLSQPPGLFRVNDDGSGERMPWTQFGHRDLASALIADPKRGGLWLGFAEGGIVYAENGRVRESFTTADGLGAGQVASLYFGPRGALWIATEGGLSRFKDGRVTNLSSRDGLPCDTVHWSIQDDQHSTWLYMPCGLVRITRAEMDAWVADPRHKVKTTVLDQSDGVRTQPYGTSASPLVAKTPDGRIWFLPFDGLSVFHPARLEVNRVPPPVHVEQVIADRKTYDTSRPIRLPPRVRDLEIDYTALSFVAPEKVRFRYRLEGRDEDWREAGNRRQAFYTDLAPGTYRFHVIAANNSGVWNTRGAMLELSIAPAWWQTKWFYAVAAAAVALLLWGAHHLRMRQLAREAAVEQEAHERQRALQMELAHASRLATMGQLTASISHEIRQPLATVLASGEAARRWLEQSNFKEVREALDAIVKATARAGEIVTGLRVLAKKEEPKLEDFDMNQAVRDVVLLAAGEAARNDVAIRTAFSGDLPWIRGNRIQLQQVLLNLVLNSIQAIGPDSELPREVLIKTAEAGLNGVSVIVEDTGPGMDPENAAHAFDAFHTTKPSGLGMGLSICRSIIEAHNGTITLAPRDPHGLVASFVLPGAAKKGE